MFVSLFADNLKIKWIKTGNETLERLGTIGLLSNFMVYLTRVFHLEQVDASNVINIWSGFTNLTPLVGAFISDAYVGRFKTIAFASFATLLVSLSFQFTLNHKLMLLQTYTYVWNNIIDSQHTNSRSKILFTQTNVSTNTYVWATWYLVY